MLVASLHQAIADVLPTRLGFYENWLHAERLRGGSIGLAPLSAVLSFLRLEGEAYDLVTTRAGEYAADWTVQSMAPLRRAVIKRSPEWMRRRLMLRVARHLVRSTYQGSRPTARLRRRTAEVSLGASVFCVVREPVGRPLCGFYAAALSRLLALFDLPMRAAVVACRGTGKPECVLAISVGVARQDPSVEAA